MNRVKVFCWLPTKVWASRWFRFGTKWLSYGWVGEDGKMYLTETPIEEAKP